MFLQRPEHEQENQWVLSLNDTTGCPDDSIFVGVITELPFIYTFKVQLIAKINHVLLLRLPQDPKNTSL